MRYILHIDMDAFYASVEELHNPLYRNKPIAVSGHTKRSVIASANYIARSCGVKAAMPVFMAKNICRNLIIAYPHFHLYEELSERFTKLICEKFTNNIEIASIDECYVDITNLVNKKHSAIDVAKAIQNTIKSKIGLTCSIGIANNKFLAKMGSKYKKPLGITTMWQDELPTKLWLQPIERMHWIGKASARLLREHVINTIGDIANKNNNYILEKLLDKNWLILYQYANGNANDELDYSQNMPKSIGSSETFLNDTADFIEIKDKIVELAEGITHRLKYYQQKARTISIVIKTFDFKQHTKALTLGDYTDDKEKIILTALGLFQQHFIQTTIRLVGVTVSNLIENNSLQINSELFDDYQESKDYPSQNTENEIMISINKKFSKNIISLANQKFK